MRHNSLQFRRVTRSLFQTQFFLVSPVVGGVLVELCLSLCETQFSTIQKGDSIPVSDTILYSSEGLTSSLCQTQFFLVSPVVDGVLVEFCLSLCHTQFSTIRKVDSIPV